MNFASAIFVAIPVVASHLAGQRLIVVDAAGAGQFRQIQPAIDSAVSGDTVLVRPGSYPGFVVDKGISVVGGAGVTLESGARTAGVIRVHNLPIDQHASVRGFRGGFGVSPAAVDCRGHVHFEDLLVVHGFSQVAISNCAQVSLRGLTCSLGTNITNSTVLITQCGLAAITVDGSRVTIAESTSNAAVPGAAIQLRQSHLTLAGGRDTVIAPQAGVLWPRIDCIQATGGSIDLDPDVTLAPAGGGQAIVGTATVRTLSLPSIRVDIANSQLTTRLRAPGALRGHTLLGLVRMGSAPLPFGDLWIADSVLIDSGTIPATGERTATLPIPPGLTGVTLVEQAIIAQPNGLQLSTPVVFTLE